MVYYFPKTKLCVGTFDNLHTFGESVDEIMSNKEMSDEEIGKALLSTIKNAIESWLKISKKPKAADELRKLKEAKEEITKIINSDQFDKDAAKNCIKKLTKLFCFNIGTLIDGTTLPKRWLELAKELGAEKLFKNYSQTDIDADGQISWGVPDLETIKQVVNKQDIDSDEAEQVQELDSTSESKNRFLNKEEVYELGKTFSDDFQQMEVFEVNEEGNIYKLQAMSEDTTLPYTKEKFNKALSCILKAINECRKNVLPTYSPIIVDIDGQSVLDVSHILDA